MAKKTDKNKRGSVWIIVAVLGVIAAFTGWIIYAQVSKTQRAQTTPATETSAESDAENAERADTQVTDAAKYYRENAQKLISVTPAEESSQVYSEKDIGKELAARGFGGNFPITYEYTIDGSAQDKTEIDKTAAATHPQYTVTYMTKNGDYWTISVCNDSVTAYPAGYNLEHNKATEVIITESDSITAYDSGTNSFYKMIPKPSALVVKHIPAITAEALEKLTAQEIDAL
ncbi:MAG: hypothetical protein IKE65_08125 [Clostridia bacterium]|nr:hypothetical protein [Clostridia bacterium]